MIEWFYIMVPDYRRYVRAKKKLKKLKAKQNQAKENFQSVEFLGALLSSAQGKGEIQEAQGKGKAHGKGKADSVVSIAVSPIESLLLCSCGLVSLLH